jgi:4-carboxymuconolactone decarboxylase
MGGDRYARGLELRRSVLGSEYVEKSLASADEFGAPLQELVTEYGWGAVWARPELPVKTRSMLNLAMLTALNRPHELRIHVRGALRNGCTKDEIREIFLQTAVYCGMPAALDSMRVAGEVLREFEETGLA